MKFLIITENTNTEKFFSNLFAKEQFEIVTQLTLSENDLADLIIVIIDATINTTKISKYFNQIKMSPIELKKIFIILENPSLISDFIIYGLNNFLFTPLDEKIVQLQISCVEKLLLEFNLLFNENKKNEKNITKLEKALQLIPDGIVIVDTKSVYPGKNNLSKEGLPALEAEMIKDLALTGNVDGITALLKIIEKQDINYLPTIQLIQKMAKNLEFDKILNLVYEEIKYVQ